MRFRHPSGDIVHLAYCSNVHPAEDVDGIAGQLRVFAGGVRAALDTDVVGVGLWIPAVAVTQLEASRVARETLRGAVAAAGAEVVTLNGFPYGGFHDPVVKHAVYRPDWHEPERLTYTLGLARVLDDLMPDDVAEGSISTLPLGWRDRWSGTGEARAVLATLAEGLETIQAVTGRTIEVALEPEPGCAVETTAQAVGLLSGSPSDLVGLCLDCCHLAVAFEDPDEAVPRIRDAGVPVVKCQLSSALRAAAPAADRRDWLGEFVEPRFLHQTREQDGPGTPLGVDDLDLALDGALPGTGEWRVHFHVPIHHSSDSTTQAELAAAIDALVEGPRPLTRHLEVETYTWSVLPADQRPADDDGLVAGLARELDWARQRLVAAGLQEQGARA